MNIEIHGKRWFQKTYGNTYHTARIYVDGELVTTTPMQYGYGEQYMQTAWEWLQCNGYIDGVAKFSSYALRAELIAVSSVVDVDRKKDL